MYKLVGKEVVNYISKKTNRPVVGQYWHILSEPVNTESRVGQMTDKVFIPQSILDRFNSPHINSNVIIYFNKFGSVEEVHIVDS